MPLPQLSFKPYITSVRQEPIQELSALGQSLNQRYDDNIAKYDKLDEYINQIQLSQADAALKENLKLDTRNAIANIAANGDWENAKTPIREVARRLANDNIITKAQQNYQTARKLEEQNLKAAMEGKPLIQFQDYKNFTTVDPLTGKARDLPLEGVLEQRLDYLGAMRQIFQDVNPDSYSYQNSTPVRDEETGQIYQVGSGSQKRYLSKDKIQAVADRSFENFLNTDEGRQRLKVLTTSNSENQVPLSRDKAIKQLKSELLNVGLNKVFSDFSSTSTQKLAPGQGTGGTKQVGLGERPALEENPITSSRLNPVAQSLAKKLEFKERGGTQLSGPNVPVSELYKYATPGGGILHTVKTTPKRQGYEELSETEKNAFKKITLGLGIKDKKGGYSTNPQDYNQKDISKIQQYYKEISNRGVSPTTRAFTEDEINKNKNYVANGNYKGRNFYDIEKDEFLPFEKLPSEVKEVLQSGETKGIQFSGVYDTDNPFYDLAKKTKQFKDVKGWVSPEDVTIAGKRYAVSSSLDDRKKQDIKVRELANQISRANRYGEPVYLKSKDGDKDLVVPVGEGKYIIKNKDGSLKHQGFFTKEQLALYANEYNLEPED